MDLPAKRSTCSTQEFSQPPGEGYSADTQAASEGLAQNLSDLTLNPSTTSPSLPPEHSSQQQDTGNNSKASGLGLNPRLLYTRRRGARTVASVQEEMKKMRERLRLRMIRRLDAIKYRTLYLSKSIIDCQSDPDSFHSKNYEAVLAALPKWQECQPED